MNSQLKKLLKNCLNILKIITLLVAFFSTSSFSKENLILAVHPYLSQDELEKKFIPFANYLSEQSGFNITLKIGSSYEEHIQYIGTDQVDIAFVGPAAFVNVTSLYGSKPLLAKLEINGQSYFQGNIIVRKDSGIKTLEDLKGKNIALGNVHSTMSYIVPHHQLHDAGVFLEDHVQHPILPSHDDIALAVLSGDFDAGAVKPAVFKRYEEDGLEVLIKTQKISEHLFLTNSELPEKQQDKLRQILLNMGDSPKGLAILKGIKKSISRLVEVKENHYDNLKKIIIESKNLYDH